MDYQKFFVELVNRGFKIVGKTNSGGIDSVNMVERQVGEAFMTVAYHGRNPSQAGVDFPIIVGVGREDGTGYHIGLGGDNAPPNQGSDLLDVIDAEIRKHAPDDWVEIEVSQIQDETIVNLKFPESEESFYRELLQKLKVKTEVDAEVRERVENKDVDFSKVEARLLAHQIGIDFGDGSDISAFGIVDAVTGEVEFKYLDDEGRPDLEEAIRKQVSKTLSEIDAEEAGLVTGGEPCDCEACARDRELRHFQGLVYRAANLIDLMLEGSTNTDADGSNFIERLEKSFDGKCDIDRLSASFDREKKRRTHYQGLVYEVANFIDRRIGGSTVVLDGDTNPGESKGDLIDRLKSCFKLKNSIEQVTAFREDPRDIIAEARRSAMAMSQTVFPDSRRAHYENLIIGLKRLQDGIVEALNLDSPSEPGSCWIWNGAGVGQGESVAMDDDFATLNEAIQYLRNYVGNNEPPLLKKLIKLRDETRTIGQKVRSNRDELLRRLRDAYASPSSSLSRSPDHYHGSLTAFDFLLNEKSDLSFLEDASRDFFAKGASIASLGVNGSSKNPLAFKSPRDKVEHCFHKVIHEAEGLASALEDFDDVIAGIVWKPKAERGVSDNLKLAKMILQVSKA